MKNISGGRTNTDQNAKIGIMIEDVTTMTVTVITDTEMATTEIGTSATTPWTTTEEGMTNNTRNGKGTRITDATIEEDIFLGKSVGKQPEITIGD